MGAIGLNPIRLDRIGLDPIRINAIKLGVPRAASDRPYIDPEVLASLKAVCICYGKSNDDPDRAVVKNLVDPDNPFVISNAAFKLNSGFGKYEVDFTEYRSGNLIYVSRILPNSILATTDGPGEKALLAKFPSNENDDINDYKVEIKLTEGVQVVYKYIDNTGTLKRKYLNTSGIYDLPKSYISKLPSEFNDSIGFSASGVGEIYLSQIPSFEGAFVTDGVNDLITSTKTVQEMGITDEITVVSMIGQLSTPNVNNYTNTIRNQPSTTGSYNKVEVSAIDKTGIYGYSFNSSLKCSIINDILGDKQDYSVSLTTQVENISAKYLVQGWIDINGLAVELSSVAWYWTIIANKVLTTDEINQVIAYFNLDRTLKPDILCDVKKQGITNENHAEFGDKLIDFSGNGRDIQLNNIAWKGDSGIGKYETDFTTWTRGHFTDEVNFTPSKIEVTGILTTNSILINNKPTPIYNVEIHSPNKSIVVYYQYNDDTGVKRIALVDGINELPSANDSLFVTSDRLNSKGITITQIPSHAGALCLDGVNDFGKVTGMPVYKDYTVVTDREIFANIGAISSKNNPGAFVETAGNSVYSFGQATSGLNFISTRSISYLSKYSYCGQSITAGAAEDGTDMWLGTIRDNDSRFFNGAIYSLMSFPYSMSEFLIERQLKKHKLGTLYPDMVEFRPIVKSNLPYSSISYSVNPGEYISVDSMVTITVTLPNTSDKLMEVSCNAISDISIYGDNGVYEITGKVVKSPQKINLVISSYLTMLSNSTLISNETLIKNE